MGNNKVICGVLVFSILQMGCSSSYVVSSFSTFNADAYDRSGVIEIQDGRELDARNIKTGLDSTRFLNKTTDAKAVAPTHSIKTIVFTNHGVGFLAGFV